MASTYTPSLQIQLIGNGDQSGTWGTTTDTNWTLMEASVAGVQSIVMSNANYTLSTANGATDEARNMTLLVTGTNSGVYQVVAPLVPKIYNVVNNTSGGYAITIGASTGTTVSIPNGYASFVYCDGSTGFSPCDTASGGNFYTNGNIVVQGTSTLEGAVAAQGTLTVTGATTLNGTTALNGTSTAPTPTVGDNSTNIATTAFVHSAVGTLGTMSSQNSNSVSISGGSINGVSGTNSGMTVGNATYATTAGNGGVTSVNGSTGAVTVPSLGIGQSYQNPSRSTGVQYTNSTANPIFVSVSVSGGTYQNMYTYVNGNNIATYHISGYTNTYTTLNTFFIVPPGGTYQVNADTNPGQSISSVWWELR